MSRIVVTDVDAIENALRSLVRVIGPRPPNKHESSAEAIYISGRRYRKFGPAEVLYGARKRDVREVPRLAHSVRVDALKFCIARVDETSQSGQRWNKTYVRRVLKSLVREVPIKQRVVLIRKRHENS